MRDAGPLPPALLVGRLPPAAPDDGGRIAQVAQLADRGDHAAAAREAAALIELRHHDIRLIGFYLFGVFLESGPAGLPSILDRVGALLANDLAALQPERNKVQVVNSATAWLFEHLGTRLQFHASRRDATWETWRDASDGALADAIVDGCTRVTQALQAVIEAPLAVTPLARVRRLANDELRRSAALREAARASAARAAEVRAEPTADATADVPAEPSAATADVSAEPDTTADAFEDESGAWSDVMSEFLKDATVAAALSDPAASANLDPTGAAPVAPGRARDAEPSRAGAPDDTVVVGSPALAILQTKLRGFQTLVARGELAKAAVVASDVRAILASFDPVTFFPSLFAPYFKALHPVVDRLAPYFAGADQPSWHALDSYYRADLRAFLDDEDGVP